MINVRNSGKTYTLHRASIAAPDIGSLFRSMSGHNIGIPILPGPKSPSAPNPSYPNTSRPGARNRTRASPNSPMQLAPQPPSHGTATPTNPTQMPTTHCGNPTPTWTIHTITPCTLHEASTFINASRRTLFPSLGHNALFDDAKVLEESCVLVARDGVQEIVAAIAYTPFDYRFPHLPWPLGRGVERDACASNNTSTSNSTSTSTSTSPSPSPNILTTTAPSSPTLKTVEVVRLFVLPPYRRHGLAASLFSTLQTHAKKAGVQCMYLHTHPFLEGAVRFWEKQGFEMVCVDEEDEVWQTRHLRKVLGV